MIDPLAHLRENRLVIEERLGYSFVEIELMELAFIHKSYFYENESIVTEHNERIEFLGDAVLQLLTTEYLYRNYPQMNEGELSQYRSKLVDAEALAGYSERIGISEFIVLGKGERKQERKGSLLANLFEAVLGAIYLDGGHKKASEFLFSQIQEKIEVTLSAPSQSSKSLLQEWAQRTHQILPQYVIVSESGPDHRRFYQVEVRILDQKIGEGEGFSKKEAERKAAEDALARIV